MTSVEGAVRYENLIFESLALKKKSIIGGDCKKNPVLQKKILLLSKMLLHRFSEKATETLFILQCQFDKQIRLK